MEEIDEKKGMSRMHKIFLVSQFVIVVVFIACIFFLYPRATLDLKGNNVNFRSINANTIIISNNPDFSNPRYVDVNESISFNLKPGKYYWKASNSVLEGMSKEFEIKSEVGLEIVEKPEGSELANVGNVKLNVTKTKDGHFVGHIILEPDSGVILENNSGEYVGRQDG